MPRQEEVQVLGKDCPSVKLQTIFTLCPSPHMAETAGHMVSPGSDKPSPLDPYPSARLSLIKSSLVGKSKGSKCWLIAALTIYYKSKNSMDLPYSHLELRIQSWSP